MLRNAHLHLGKYRVATNQGLYITSHQGISSNITSQHNRLMPTELSEIASIAPYHAYRLRFYV